MPRLKTREIATLAQSAIEVVQSMESNLHGTQNIFIICGYPLEIYRERLGVLEMAGVLLEMWWREARTTKFNPQQQILYVWDKS